MSAQSEGRQLGHAEEVLLRYRYPDGRVQAAMPMRVVQDRGDWLVGWLAAGTEIAFWALPDGRDPRVLPLEERFSQRLTTAPRAWQGNGVLRVIPVHEPYQVIHFWDDTGGFVLACLIQKRNLRERGLHQVLRQLPVPVSSHADFSSAADRVAMNPSVEAPPVRHRTLAHLPPRSERRCRQPADQVACNLDISTAAAGPHRRLSGKDRRF